MVIEGEPGIGKTTLFRSAVSAAEAAGYLVLSCWPGPAEVSLSFAVLADLLSELDAGQFDRLPPVQRDAIEAVLLRGDAGPRGADERLVCAGVRSLLEHLARERPVLMAVDDAQWVDTASREVLSFVTRRLVGPVKILATLRTGADSVQDADWVVKAGYGPVDRIQLQPLSLGPLARVVSAELGHALPRPAMVRVAELSGGNPFYAIELARTVSENPRGLPEMLPASLTAAVRDRIAGLDEDARQLLLSAACAADPTVELLAAACAITPADLVLRLEVAERRGVVEFERGRVRFTHPLLATGVYAATPGPARRAMHKRLADHVYEPELRARHLALGSTSADSATLDALDTAAELIRSRGAPAAAADLVELAISLGGDNPLRRMRAAEQHFRAGSLRQARLHLDEVFSRVRSGDLWCLALMLLGAVEGYGGNLSAAVDALGTAAREANAPRLRLQALVHLVPATGIRGDLKTCVELARDAVALAEQEGDPDLHSQALSMWVDVSYLYGLGVDEDALDVARDLERRDGDAAAPFQAGAVATVIAGRIGDLETAISEIADLHRRLTDRGSETDLLWVADHAVRFNVWLGRYQEANDAAREALQRAEQMGGQHGLITALSGVAMVAAHLGDTDDARAAAKRALDAAHRLGAGFMLIAPTATIAFIEVSVGRYDRALKAVQPLLANFDPAHDTEIWVSPWLPDAVDALCCVGHISEAERLVDALEDNGERHDRPWMLAVGARGRAMCLAGDDVDAAVSHAQAALAHHARLPMPFERARTLLLLGQLERRRRRKAVAAALFEEARTVFDSLGAPLWAARTYAERRRVHIGTPERATLTPTESRVAELAVAGMTNRDIAAQLFVSVKTVEATVSRIYRKLGIRSRAELAYGLQARD